MNTLERVWKRFTGMVPGMRNFSYEDTLERLGLFSLERRRISRDLLEMFKIMSRRDRVETVPTHKRIENESDLQKKLR